MASQIFLLLSAITFMVGMFGAHLSDPADLILLTIATCGSLCMIIMALFAEN